MSDIKLEPGKVYSIFGGFKEIKADLEPGSIVSYGDQANPRRKAVVTDIKDMYGSEVIFLENYNKSHCSTTALDGPGGWHREEGKLSAEEIDGLKGMHEIMMEARRRKTG